LVGFNFFWITSSQFREEKNLWHFISSASYLPDPNLFYGFLWSNAFSKDLALSERYEGSKSCPFSML